MNPERGNGEPTKSNAPWMRYAGMGSELAGGIIAFVLIGYWIDQKLGTEPVWLTTLASIGCIGGLYNLIRRAIQMQRDAEKRARRLRDRESGSPGENDREE